MGTIITFTETDELPAAIQYPSKPVLRPKLCIITGKPAKYKDPLTGQPYATVEAFKVIRSRLAKGEQLKQEIQVDASNDKIFPSRIQ